MASMAPPPSATAAKPSLSYQFWPNCRQLRFLSGFPPRFVIVAHTQTPNQDHLRRIFLWRRLDYSDKSPIWFREPDSRMIRQKRARIKVEKSKQMEEDPLVGDHGSVMTGFLRRISLITAIIVTRPPAYWADLT